MSQINLFGPATETIPAPFVPKVADRKEMMIAAMDAEKNKACVEVFESFLIAYNERHSLFIIQDVVLAYKRANKPLPAKDFRCIGGIINRLTNKGVLVKTGDRRDLQDGTGRLMIIYRGKG